MNCRNAEPRIPLFVEADLDAAEMQQMTAHLETCAACQTLAAEFHASQASLRAAVLPAFDEAMLALMRSAVQREIAPMTSRPSITEWLHPLWNWNVAFAAAAVILLVSGIVLSRRDAGLKNEQVASRTKDSVPSDATPPQTESVQKSLTASQVFQPQMGRKYKAQGRMSTSERNPENNEIKPLSSARAIDVDNQIAAASIAPSRANNDAVYLPRVDTMGFTFPPAPQAETITSSTGKSTPEPEMLRMEFQTADPNIKIIWLTPKEPTRTNPVADTK